MAFKAWAMAILILVVAYGIFVGADAVWGLKDMDNASAFANGVVALSAMVRVCKLEAALRDSKAVRP